jgi:hypothetical protein
MVSGTRTLSFGVAVLFLLLVCLNFASAQGLQSVLHSTSRVLPSVGLGIAGLKADGTGHYYVLAQPATQISIYDRTGNRVGQIPNANSHGAVIHYAASFDIDPQGRLIVADRGANAVVVFAPNGALLATIPVTAPTSVVALSDGQFAVTKLQSKRLVQIMDLTGATVRTFGDPADEPGGDHPSPALIDRGRITGDGIGNIYFAFTSLPDPALQRFDRFGYSAYDTTVSAQTFGDSYGRTGHEIDLGYTMSGVGGPTSVTAWTDLHSVKSVSVGKGRGGGGRRGQAAATAQGPNGPSPNGTQSASSSSDDSVGQLALDPSDLLMNYSADDSTYSAIFDSPSMADLDPALMSPGMLGMGFGGGFHGGFHGDFGGGADPSHPDFAGRTADGSDGFEHFGHFHPGFETYRATATLKVALDDPSKHAFEKPMITAVGIDPKTQDAWAAIGDTLVHFDSFGNRLEMYYITISGDVDIKPSAILVEPNRILIAADPWGIYEFPRPDKVPAAAANTEGPDNVVPKPVSSPTTSH